MIDRNLYAACLRALNIATTNGMREPALCNDVAMAVDINIDAGTVREHLRHAETLGHIRRSRGILGETRWCITTSGANALQEL